MLRRIKAFFRPELVEVRPVYRDILRITVDEWKTNKASCAAAGQALRDPTVRQMIDVCRTSHLGNFVLQKGTIEEMAVHLARCEGYQICLNNLESLAVYQEPNKELEATFEDPKKESEL